MSVHVTLGGWEAQQLNARRIRVAVFIEEQKVPLDMEWDDMDAVSEHAIAFDTEGKAVATGRLLPDGHIGRMAVLEHVRGQGIGGAVLDALMTLARKRGDRAVMLNAQVQAEQFYRRYGFEREGNVFMEAGIPHLHMRHAFT